MPNPKRRHSKSRTSSGARTALKPMAMGECPQCHELKLPHTVCANCGFYAGVSKACRRRLAI